MQQRDCVRICDENENSYHSVIGQSLGTVLEDEDNTENEVENEQDEDEDRMYVPGQPDRSYFEDDIQREFDELRQMGYSFGNTYKYLGDETNFLSGSRPPEDENLQTEIPKLKSDDDSNSGLTANAKNFDKLGSSEETWKHYNEYNHDPDGTIDNGFMPHEQNFVTEIYETEEVPLPDYSEKAGLQSADEGSKDENVSDDTDNTDEGSQDEGEKSGESESYVSLETADEENGGKDEKDYYGYSQNDDTEANDFQYQNEDDLNDKETFDVEKENENDVDDGNEDDEGEYDTEGANDEDDEGEYDTGGVNDEDDEDEYDNEGENDEDDEDEFDSEGENDEDNEDEYDTRGNIDEDQDDSSEDALISDDSIVADEVQKTKSYSNDLSSERLTEEEEYALLAMLEGKVQFKESLGGWDVQSLSVPDTGGESLSSYSLGSTLGMMNGTLGSQKKFAKSSNGKDKRSVKQIFEIRQLIHLIFYHSQEFNISFITEVLILVTS